MNLLMKVKEESEKAGLKFSIKKNHGIFDANICMTNPHYFKFY